MAQQGGDWSKRIVILMLPGVLGLDAFGPYEAFLYASRLVAQRAAGRPLDCTDGSCDGELPLRAELAGLEAGPVESMSLTQLYASVGMGELLEAAGRGEIDTLIVAGGDLRKALPYLVPGGPFLAHLGHLAQGARRLASTCTGSLILAAAGLLDGRRATTHWTACEFMRGRFTDVQLEDQPIFVQDGNVYTSAGGTTSMDLALAMVAEDFGDDIAQEVARLLVLYVRRSGCQPQLSAPLRVQAERAPLRELQALIVEHPEQNHSVPSLAARVGMSVRAFSRTFRRELGVTPAAYVESVRVEAATRKLELGRGTIQQVAFEVGFGSVESLRRAFIRQRGMPPSMLRQSR